MSDLSPRRRDDELLFDRQIDPYQPPADTTGDEPVRYPMERAGAGTRLLGFVIDYIAHIVLLFAILFLAGFVRAVVKGDEDAGDFLGDQLEGVLNLISALGLFLYYVFFEGFFSRTLGKFVTGTIVVQRDGYPPSFRQILGRTLARFIPFDPLSYLSSGSRGWHDSLSGTYVVMRRRARGRGEE